MEREFYDYYDWLEAGADPTYGQGASQVQYPVPMEPPAPPTTPTTPPTGGGGGKTPQQIEAEGREYDRLNNLIGGYFDTLTGVWVNGSPRRNPTDPIPGGDLTSFSGGGFPAASAWPSYSMPSFDPGPAFSYKDFSAPSSQDVLNDPGFQFRIDQGRKALESSAAGKGILRSGGTLKDLLSYGQNFASQEYGNVYDRALREYDTNRRNAWDSWSSGYMGRKDKYGFDQGNAQFGFNANQRQAEFDRDEVFKRWQTEGGWLKDLGIAGME